MVQKIIREYSEKPALKAYIEIFLTLIAISLFGVFAIRPTTITIGNLVKEIDAKKKTLEVMNQKIDNLESAKALFEKESEKIKLIDDAIPSEPKPDILALQIEELAKKNNVSLNSLSIEDTKILGDTEGGSDQDITLSINITGGYFGLINFSKDLENLRRPIKYDGITIAIFKEKDSESLLMTFVNSMTPFLEKK